jgi:hypothetical protein
MQVRGQADIWKCTVLLPNFCVRRNFVVADKFSTHLGEKFQNAYIWAKLKSTSL